MDSDILGQRGEAIFVSLITDPDALRGPLFRPQFLGEKWPVVDFIVELVGVQGHTPYFFVQVKTTEAGFTARERRLKVKVKTASIERLALYPAPAYIVGIDANNEAGYIVSANGEHQTAVSSLSTRFSINAANRVLLWAEINAYWNVPPQPKLASAFYDPAWK